MKKRIFIISIMFCFLFNLVGPSTMASATAVTEKPVNTEVTDFKALSKELALQMADGKFKDTYDNLAAVIKLQVTETALKEAWDKSVAGIGKFIEVYNISQVTEGQYQIVDVILRFENNGLMLEFTFNNTGKIEGLWFKYAPIEVEAVVNDKFEETKITFGEGEYPISGILTLPKNVKKPPVVILVPGSGNHDFNESILGNKPFQDIAWGLAEKGIASIRYDERIYLYPAVAQQEYTIQTDSLNDAGDAIDYALSSKKINTSKIFVVGHSLGGMMAPKIAADHKKVAGILILAGSPRKLEDIVYDQVSAAVKNTKGITVKQVKETMALTSSDMKAVKNLKRGGTSILLSFPSSYWYSLNQIDIPAIAKKLTIPMFVAQGSKDFQVYADKDYKLWKETLSKKKNVTYKLYDNLNHLFMTTNGKSDISEYEKPGNVDQTVINDMAKWIKKW